MVDKKVSREIRKQVKLRTNSMSRELKEMVKEMVKPATATLRQDILSDLWACNKKVVDGKWYIELSQAVEVIGGSNE